MQVQVGPVSSASVIAWVTFARAVLANISNEPPNTVTSLSPDVARVIERYLTTWVDLAVTKEEFLWNAEVDVEEVEFLAHTWFCLAGSLSAEAEARGLPLGPAEGEDFYQSLVASMLDALAYEGRSLRDFAERLRNEWPGLKPT